MRFFLNLFSALAVSSLLLGTPALAQNETLTDEQRDALFSEFVGITFDRNRAYKLNKAFLTDSFVSHLGDLKSRLTIEDISTLPTAYDPSGDTPLTAGVVLFDLAHSNKILRQLGGASNETYVQTLEIRILWLAGDTDGALKMARDLIADLDRLDTSDPIQTSLLTDAAVLAYRAGKVAEARSYLTRARSCGVPNCPEDILFGWIGTGKDDRLAKHNDYDPAILQNQAIETAAKLFPGNTTITKDIRREAFLISGRSATMLSQANALSQTNSNPDNLTSTQRRDMRRLAERMLTLHDFVGYLMNSDSVAKAIYQNGDTWGETLEDYEDVGYLDGCDGLLMQNVPILHALTLVSDPPRDWIVAELMRISVILSKGQRERGLSEL